MMLPNYRVWVVLASLTVCFATWFVIEKTRLGAYLRAGTENPRLVEAFGVNVPVMITLTMPSVPRSPRLRACSLRLFTKSLHSWGRTSSSSCSRWS